MADALQFDLRVPDMMVPKSWVSSAGTPAT